MVALPGRVLHHPQDFRVGFWYLFQGHPVDVLDCDSMYQSRDASRCFSSRQFGQVDPRDFSVDISTQCRVKSNYENNSSTPKAS
jgi:hypothetical protein